MSNGYSGPLSVLEVHLDAVARNYLFLANKLKKGADCGAVVKADAYGLGAAEISKVLYGQNCRHFFVATFEEGLAVRAALSFPLSPSSSRAEEGKERGEAAIYAFHGPRGAAPEDFVRESIIPVLNTPDDIEYWTGFAKKTGKKQQAVLHIDTGMNRLGLTAAETARLTPDLLKPLDVRHIMSHLACTDEPGHPKNREQLDLFTKLTAETGMACRYSLANSGGILMGEAYHFDIARPGAGIYGINPQPQAPNPMHGTVTFKVRVLQARQIDRPGTVGYGATYKISPPAKCATVSIGYADGYLRSFMERGMVVINGRKCPVIGRVSMDSIVVDTNAMTAQPQAGDWAHIIGPDQTVDEVAGQEGTIGYEVLTSLGKRYKRSYV